MKSVRSHRVLITAALIVCAACVSSAAQPASSQLPGRSVPMIHVTDLFRPHDDPDDHWDLACVYSLAYQGLVELRGVLIDFPKPERPNDPDVLGVAQMNYLTGKAVPILVGSPNRITAETAEQPENMAALRGVRAMLDIMRQSPEPVVINILGSCRDVAIAGHLEPELFSNKCAAIYLNAGSGTRDPALAERLEWNVSLDPASYSDIFTLPCPVYWMPCFEVVGATPAELFRVAGFGTYYRFQQGEILPQASEGVQQYFAYMFKQGRLEAQHRNSDTMRPNWLQYLAGPKDPELLARINAMQRNMWCTGGFLHAVGRTVTCDGTIVPLGQDTDPVFTFDPIQVSCNPAGITQWKPDSSSQQRFIFHVRDPGRYASAMTTALRALVVKLP